MTDQKKTYVDVLEELIFVTESLCEDIAGIVAFKGKSELFQDAVDLHQLMQRRILSNKCYGVLFDKWARAIRDEDSIPF